MKDLQAFDIINISNFNKRSDIFLSFLNKYLKFRKIQKIYGEHSFKHGLEFVDAIINELNLQIETIEKEVQKIPAKGSFITISNFPMGGIEALILFKIISEKRPDFKIISPYRFHEIGPLEAITIPLNKGKANSTKPCIDCTKKILTYLRDGNAVGFFPAGVAAKYDTETKKILDTQWDIKLTKLIKIAAVPVIPVYFNDAFGKLFHILGNLHPVLQSLFIQKEMFKKRDSIINVRIGNAIKLNELDKFSDIWLFTRFLRARTYALGASASIDVNIFFKYIKKFKIEKVEEIISPIDPQIIINQINNAKKDHLLYSSRGFDIICAPTSAFPDVLTELGRLREKTFREVGEGTNKSLDIDEFDLYYNHLVIWDNEQNKIVGAYRIGRGDEIIERYSVKGFYLSTLFKIKKGLIPVLNQSLEMGRSFIVKEYQRKPFSLFMLWKGILYFLLKNPQYRYLTGPVSISQKFSELTKNLIVSFFEEHHFDKKMAKYVKHRKKYRVEVNEFDKNILLQGIGNDVNKLDKYVKEIEPGSSIPVLFKKYISLGAKTIAFNVDPKFNNCLDGLMILDIFELPEDTLKVLAKDLDDDSVLSRFNIDVMK